LPLHHNGYYIFHLPPQVVEDDEIKSVEEFRKKYPQGEVLDEGTFTLCSSATEISDGTLYIAAPKDKDLALSSSKEIFSFGAGEWEEGGNAEELYTDTDGPWLAMVLSPDTPVLLDKTNLPEELLLLDCVSQQVVRSLDHLLGELETSGETKLRITAHNVTRQNLTHKVDQESHLAFKMSVAKVTIFSQTTPCLCKCYMHISGAEPMVSLTF
jgi:hypothetical protein